MSAPKVKIPPPPVKSVQELEQISLQNDLLKTQIAQNERSLTILNEQIETQRAQEAEVREAFEETFGGFAGALKTQAESLEAAQRREEKTLQIFEDFLTGAEDDELNQLEREIALEAGERTLAGLRGELPVDPALERDLANRKEEVKERLLRQLGPGFETSSPGIETLARFDEEAQVVRSAVRQGQLTTNEAVALGRTQAASDRQTRFLNTLSQFGTFPTSGVNPSAVLNTQPGLPASIGATAGLLNSNIATLAALESSIGGARGERLSIFNTRAQGAIANANAQSQFFGSLFQGIGSLGGGVLGGGLSTGGFLRG